VQRQFSPNALIAAGLLVDEVMKRFGWGQGKRPEPPQLLPQRRHQQPSAQQPSAEQLQQQGQQQEQRQQEGLPQLY
jgi:hypothetical protein